MIHSQVSIRARDEIWITSNMNKNFKFVNMGQERSHNDITEMIGIEIK